MSEHVGGAVVLNERLGDKTSELQNVGFTLTNGLILILPSIPLRLSPKKSDVGIEAVASVVGIRSLLMIVGEFDAHARGLEPLF